MAKIVSGKDLKVGDIVHLHYMHLYRVTQEITQEVPNGNMTLIPGHSQCMQNNATLREDQKYPVLNEEEFAKLSGAPVVAQVTQGTVTTSNFPLQRQASALEALKKAKDQSGAQ